MQPIFHLLGGETYCLIPLSSHRLTLLPSPPSLPLVLQNDPLLRYPGHIQQDNEYLT